MRVTYSLSRRLLGSAVRGAPRRTWTRSALSAQCLAPSVGNAKLFPSSSCLGSGRLFSTSKPDKGDLRMPSLMDFPKRLFPNLVNTARNWFIATTLITPYFDNGGSLLLRKPNDHKNIYCYYCFTYAAVSNIVSLFPEFSRAEFVEGAKAAVEYVSGALSEGEFDRLKSVVSPECLSHLKYICL